jgi:DNA-directed RNA polymerase III subunit RPC11
MRCRSCIHYTHTIENEMRRSVLFKPRESDAVVGGDNELELAATCEKRCTNCGSEKAMFIEMQTRSADEPMTIFYQCVSCRKVWKE